MRGEESKSVLLGVTGGIAAYKAADLARELRRAGFGVQVAMTAAATKFITPLTLAALTGKRVITSLFEDRSDEETLQSAIAHIDVARAADAFLVAPASADVIAKLALGLADDFLTTAHLAFRGPLLVAPAMNTNMWEHPATRENLAMLRSRGATVVEPGFGELACGTVGAGRMAGLDSIVAAVHDALRPREDLNGEHVLVTAGPTREALDPVRYISNRSSGRMGFALAAEAERRGASVTLIAGPVALPTPKGCERIDVETASQMCDAVLDQLGVATIVVMAAAVADYRPVRRAGRKLKKRDGPPHISLVETPDILRTVGERKGDRIVVGFAAETNDLEANARRKLRAKGCDLVMANPVGGETGFDTDINQGILLRPAGEPVRIEPVSKAEMAARILDEAIGLRQRRAA